MTTSSSVSDLVRLERLLPGPIERVWSFLTESSLRQTWLAGGQMDLVSGGSVSMIWYNDTLSDEPTPERFAKHEGSTMTGTVLVCEAPHLLVYTWPMGDAVTEVRFELEARGDDVMLVLTHSKLATDERRRNVAAGWTAHVEVFQQRLAGTQPIVFWAHLARAEEEMRHGAP